MPKRYRAGAIGCGFFAANHLHAWAEMEDVDLVAVCDLDRKKAEAAAATYGVPSVYDDADAMLKSEKLDFVDIITTMPTHRPLAELVARHGLPMIVQKPFAPTIEDCRAIVDAAAAAGVPLMVHENFRFQTPIKAVRAVLESGVIGRAIFRPYRLADSLRRLCQSALSRRRRAFSPARSRHPSGGRRSLTCSARSIGSPAGPRASSRASRARTRRPSCSGIRAG